MIYVLNTPILTNYGTYQFYEIDPDYAIDILMNEKWVSAVGHQGTADFMSKLFGINIPMNRIQVTMQTGDRAIVFRLLKRLQEGVVLTEEELKHIPFEIALLEKIA